MVNQAATLEYLPLGVVGVIGPWNYPVFTPMGSIAYALAAGNTRGLQAQRADPGRRGLAGRRAARGRAAAPPAPGRRRVAARPAPRCAARPIDKLAFTGSTATGKKVMATCAENLTPVLIEAGGKDALIVDEDADVAAAADAAAWGAFSNAGQTCIGVERVYVHEKVYADFVGELTRLAGDVRAGSGDGAKYGPMTMPSQVDVIKGQVEDAVAKGATVTFGDVSDLGAEPDGAADRADRRPGRLHRDHRGDLRTHRRGDPGPGHGRGRASWPTPRRTAWGRRSSRRRAGPSWPGGCARG